MLDRTYIAHKEVQDEFTKTSSPLVASFKIGASLFLIFLFDVLNFFAFLLQLPLCFLTFRSVQATIDGVHVYLLSLPVSTVSPPMLFHAISCASFLLNFKVGINFPPLRKCPSTSAVFTSVTARYHANFLSGQKLVAHVLSIEIGACLLLLWSSTWWRQRKCKLNGWRQLNILQRH